MNIIQPKAEWWQQSSLMTHIARVGRICYKSKGKEPAPGLDDTQRKAFIFQRDKERCESFWNSGHRSMYRHGTSYFFVKNDREINNRLWSLLVSSPYIDYFAQEHKVWISTNMQFLCEHPQIKAMLDDYFVTEYEFISRARRNKCIEALYLLRMTFVVTTQISTSRELNRTSPNAIAEQSTRYCNLEKKGGVQIAEPHWFASGTWWQRFLFRASCQLCDWAYRLLLRSGLKPQDARGVLPLDTYTVVAYTYSIAEWKNIIDLRYHGTTGKPHPNAIAVVSQIRDTINERMKNDGIEL